MERLLTGRNQARATGRNPAQSSRIKVNQNKSNRMKTPTASQRERQRDHRPLGTSRCFFGNTTPPIWPGNLPKRPRAMKNTPLAANPGQLLSSRADLLPERYLKALARLQDKIKPTVIVIKSLPTILFRMTNPVEPFNFQGIHNRPLLVLLGDMRKGLGQPADLFEPFADGPVNRLEKIHSGFPAPAVRRPHCR